MTTSTTASTTPLILASSSPYRRKLLSTITKNFSCLSPNINESKKAEENIQQMVQRLAIEKAQAVVQHSQPTSSLIIGSDQAAEFAGRLIGKPKNHAAAKEHLLAVSGKSITLHTGLALLNSATQALQSIVVPSTVYFRPLTEAMVDAYLQADKPYDCAGSLKVESLGIVMIERIQSDDPNALIGLPLIELTTMLNNEEYPLLING